MLTRPIEVSARADVENDSFDTDEQWKRCIITVVLRQLVGRKYHWLHCTHLQVNAGKVTELRREASHKHS